jgi:hypothetical protein
MRSIKDEPFSRLADLDVLRMGGRLHRSLRHRFDVLDCISIGIGFYGEIVIAAQPEPDLDDVLAHGAPPSITGSHAPARIASAFGDRGSGALPPEPRVQLFALPRVRQNLEDTQQGFEVIGLALYVLAEM